MQTVGTRIVKKQIELKEIRKLYNNSKLKRNVSRLCKQFYNFR